MPRIKTVYLVQGKQKPLNEEKQWIYAGRKTVEKLLKDEPHYPMD